MQIIPNDKSSPRLLESAAVDFRRDSSPNSERPRHKLSRSGGPARGRAILFGLLLGGLVIAGGGYFSHQRESVEHQFASVRRFFAVRTQSVFLTKPAGNEGGPLSVQIDPSMIRVTAIALGHPRLAIINGKEVTEGDALTLTSRGGGISVTLRVVNIVEGRIELTDGTHVVTAPLSNSR